MRRLGSYRALAAHFEHFAFTPHEHDHYVVGLVGNGLQAFELGRHSFFTPPGDLILINPGEGHTGRAAQEEGFSYLAFYPEPEALRAFAEGSGLDGRGIPYFGRTLVRDPELHRLLWACGQGVEADPLARDTAFTLALRELLRRHGNRAERPGEPAPARRELLAVRDHLHAELANPVRLEDLARVAGLSPFHLARQFRAAFGLPPHKYLEGLRVRRAQSLLGTGLSLAEVALACGFSSQSHLNRSFKRILGVTPTAYA